jgi:hypothetical protein
MMHEIRYSTNEETKKKMNGRKAKANRKEKERKEEKALGILSWPGVWCSDERA